MRITFNLSLTNSKSVIVLALLLAVQVKCLSQEATATQASKSPDEMRDELSESYNRAGKKFSKYFPGAYFYVDETVGKILNDGVFKQQVQACKFVGKRFAKVDNSNKNYIPSVIRDWKGGNFGIDNKGMLIRTSAGDLIKSVMTSSERDKLQDGTIDINTILSQKRQIGFSNSRISGLTILDATKAKNNFAYSCSCTGYVSFAISGEANKIPLGRFKAGFEVEASNKASLYLLEGNFRSPLFSLLSPSKPDLSTYIDLWSYFVDLANRDGGIDLINQDLYYVSEFNGILSGHEQDNNVNRRIQSELKIDANVSPVTLSTKFESNSEKKENFVGQNWNIIAYGDLTDKKKYQIYTEKFPSVAATKTKIEERVTVISTEDVNIKAIANNSNYTFFVHLKGLNKILCGPENQFRYNHVSGDNVWSNISNVNVSSSYDEVNDDCVCKISGTTGNNVAPAGTISNYVWKFSLKHPLTVNGNQLEFNGSHNESSTVDPRLIQNAQLVQNGIIPKGDGSNSFVWDIPIRVIDDDRKINRVTGTIGSIDGTPTFSAVGGDNQLLNAIRINELRYVSGGYSLTLELPNVLIGRFVSDFANQYLEVNGSINASILLLDNSRATVSIQGVKFKLPTYIDEDKDGIADYQDLCKGFSSPTNTDADGDGIGDPCDLCPNVKNSISENVDADKDGIGDKCDKCPNDATNSCPAAKANN